MSSQYSDSNTVDSVIDGSLNTEHGDKTPPIDAVTCSKPSVLEVVAKAICYILHPLLMPGYVVAVMFFGTTDFSEQAFYSKIFLLFWVVLYTAVAPLMFMAVLKFVKLVDSYKLQKTKDRLIPMLFVAICYMTAMISLSDSVGFLLARKFFIGPAILLCLTAIISTWWKISMHSAALGAVAALFYVVSIAGMGNVKAELFAAILLAGLVGTSRIMLGFHNVAQVVVGFIVGFSVILLSFYL